MKKLVFLSHITEEQELANLFKGFLEDSFLGMIEVFVSSNEDSLPAGTNWLDDITKALKECAVEVLLCSKESIGRRWINFEAGAGWVRGIPVIPLCHSGLARDQLPPPLSSRQAANASDPDHVRRVFASIAAALGSATPTPDFDKFTESVKVLEERFTFWTQMERFMEMFPEGDRMRHASSLAGGVANYILQNVWEEEARPILAFAPFLQKNNVLLVKRGQAYSVHSPNRAGHAVDLVFQPLSRASSVFRDRKFKYRIP